MNGPLKSPTGQLGYAQEHAIRVSVVIPVYNAEAYLKEAIESCLAQTSPPYQIIIVDDGSLDCSRDISESFVKNYPEVVQLFALPENLGEGAARAAGMGIAEGDIILWADADDIQDSNRILETVRCFREDPALDLCMSGGELIDAEGRPIGRPLIWPSTFGEFPLLWELSRNYFLGGFSACRRKIGIEYSRAHRFSPDYDFFLRALLAGKKFRHIYKPLTKYRIHSSNQSHDFQGTRAALEKTLAGINAEEVIGLLKSQGCADADIFLHLAENLLTQERPQQALECLEKAAGLPGGDLFKISFYSGVGELLLKRAEKSCSHFLRASEINPAEPTVFNNLGYVFDLLGDQRKSMDHLKIAIAIKPEYLDAQKNIERKMNGESCSHFTTKILRESWFF